MYGDAVTLVHQEDNMPNRIGQLECARIAYLQAAQNASALGNTAQVVLLVGLALDCKYKIEASR